VWLREGAAMAIRYPIIQKQKPETEKLYHWVLIFQHPVVLLQVRE
jgi:hypothetical protein